MLEKLSQFSCLALWKRAVLLLDTSGSQFLENVSIPITNITL